MTKKKKGAKIGRPTKFKKNYIELAERYSRHSLTYKDIADLLGNNISENTVNSWVRRIPAFARAIKKGRAVAKEGVTTSLYTTAMKGNVTAMIFWLGNRYPKEWKSLYRTGEIHEQQEEKKKDNRRLLQALLQPLGNNGKLLVEKLQEEYMKAGGGEEFEAGDKEQLSKEKVDKEK